MSRGAARTPAVFDDLLSANAAYRQQFALAGLEPIAARGLAVVTCIDSRIEPLAMLGLRPGDAKILRNAGARVTDDMLRSLVLAVNLLGVRRVAVVPHTRCAMAQADEGELQRKITASAGADASGWQFLAVDDVDRVVADDLQRIRACPLLPDDLEIGALLYDVDDGGVRLIATA